MKKRLVVIGGGFAGSYIAIKLENKFDLTLIDDKDYFEFTPSILRTILEPKKIHEIQALHKDYLKKANVIQGSVTSIDKSFVYIKEEKIPYDYLAICSGSNYELPIKAHNLVETTRANNLLKNHDLLEKSKRVLLIGGGLAGIELAAEISSHYKDKEVTLVSSSKDLMKRSHKKSTDYAENFLIKNNVKIVKEERIIEHKENYYISESGKKYYADLAYLCTGISPNYKFMKENFSKALNEKNHIMINEFLQVMGENNIFCAGDVNNVNVEKTAQSAIYQARIIIKNILALEKGLTLSKYVPKSRGLVISLGKRKGIFEHNNIILKGFIPAVLKYLIEKFEMRRYH